MRLLDGVLNRVSFDASITLEFYGGSFLRVEASLEDNEGSTLRADDLIALVGADCTLDVDGETLRLKIGLVELHVNPTPKYEAWAYNDEEGLRAVMGPSGVYTEWPRG